MSHKKAGGSTALGRDSQSKRLGVKIYGGQPTQAGNVLVRQRGTKIRPGENVAHGADDTLYAKIAGMVKFTNKKVRAFTGNFKKVKFISVVPQTK